MPPDLPAGSWAERDMDRSLPVIIRGEPQTRDSLPPVAAPGIAPPRTW